MPTTRTPVPSKGTTIEYNVDVAATPTDPGWLSLGCIQAPEGVGGVTTELAEHRCLDASERFVTKYPTGFTMGDDLRVRVLYTGKKMKTLRDFQLALNPLLWRTKYPKEVIDGVVQTTAATDGAQYYIQKAVPIFDSDGKAIQIELTLGAKSEPIFTEGVPSGS